jgi:hypothetical protein
MFRKLFILLLMSAVVLSACSGVLAAIERPADTPDTPVSPDDPDQDAPAGNSWQPRPGDEDLQRGEVEIDSVDILVSESYPPQYVLHMTGWKGTPCHELRVTVSETDERRRIIVDAYTLVDPDTICIQMLEGFDINVPLETRQNGEHSLWLNGQEIGTIAP